MTTTHPGEQIVTANPRALATKETAANMHTICREVHPMARKRKAAWSGLPFNGLRPFNKRATVTKAMSAIGTHTISNGAKNPQLETRLYPVPKQSAAIKNPSKFDPLSPQNILCLADKLNGRKAAHALERGAL